KQRPLRPRRQSAALSPCPSVVRQRTALNPLAFVVQPGRILEPTAGITLAQPHRAIRREVDQPHDLLIGTPRDNPTESRLKEDRRKGVDGPPPVRRGDVELPAQVLERSAGVIGICRPDLLDGFERGQSKTAQLEPRAGGFPGGYPFRQARPKTGPQSGDEAGC